MFEVVFRFYQRPCVPGPLVPGLIAMAASHTKVFPAKTTTWASSKATSAKISTTMAGGKHLDGM
jgi:hypothetical protein